ncbi:uncharacterized protein LODBEIA_P23460 [Lodderomyces beijingensis]|uniref:Gfo/Idh/MocA-like oxidoreductase N-terminal domain-containing protein n=1 Tax=Lodderomyces beijingensis TaxID=1775926 RepID=A0ABP0ZL67_9ASCO
MEPNFQHVDSHSSNKYAINQHHHHHQQSTEKISFIVIGAGLIGPRHAEHIVSHHHDCTLMAIVDHSAKGPSVASKFGVPLYSNLDEFFQNAPKLPQAAIIATPNHTHLAIGMQLINRGINILIEKPLASTATDCQTLIQFAKYKQVKMLVGHHRRFNPYIITTKQNLAKIGKIVALQGCWTLCKPPSYFLEKPWRSLVEQNGGTLLINLIHDLDLLQFLIGPIVKIYAELLEKQRTDRWGFPGITQDEDLVDEGAVLTLKFANGCCGTFVCSDNVSSPFSFEHGTGENPTIPFMDDIQGTLRVFGSNGTISVPDMKLYHQGLTEPGTNSGEDQMRVDGSVGDGNSMNGNSEENRSWLKPIHCQQLTMNQKPPRHVHQSMLLTPSSSPDFKHDSPIHYTHSAEVKHQDLHKIKPFDLQLEHFVNLLTNHETHVKCSGEDALRALLCIEAVQESIRTGMPQYVQDLDSIDPDFNLLNEYLTQETI